MWPRGWRRWRNPWRSREGPDSSDHPWSTPCARLVGGAGTVVHLTGGLRPPAVYGPRDT